MGRGEEKLNDRADIILSFCEYSEVLYQKKKSLNERKYKSGKE